MDRKEALNILLDFVCLLIHESLMEKVMAELDNLYGPQEFEYKLDVSKSVRWVDRGK